MRKSYTCEVCHRTFPMTDTLEDLQTEYYANFPGQSADDVVNVCDDCYKVIMAWYTQSSEHNPNRI